jgi:hypothetical protein
MRRPNAHLVIICLILLLALPTSVSARDWYVAPDGTGDAPTIQAAVDSAAAGDVVLLASGTFRGDGNRDIDFSGKAITVTSEAREAALCIIDCEGSEAEPHRGFQFISGEGQDAVLEAITITGGYARSGGGIICLESSAPVVRNCHVKGCEAGLFGGGIHARFSSPRIEACQILDNISSHGGGGVNLEFSHSYVENCYFSRNQARDSGGGLWSTGNGGITVDRCVFWENSCWSWGGGGGLCFGGEGNWPVVMHCTIAKNDARYGAGIHLWASYDVGHPPTTIHNTIIALNTTGEGVGADGSLYVVYPDLECCDIWGNEGGDWVGIIEDYYLGIWGNICECPSFCHAELGDLSLCDQSPCLPGNHPDGYDCGLIGAWSMGCSCGPTRTEPSTWGSIKATFR